MQLAPVPAGSQFALVSTGTGYRVEILLPLAAMDIVPTSGYSFGLDVHVNDDDDGGPRDLKLTWHGTTDDAWRYPACSRWRRLTTASPARAACEPEHPLCRQRPIGFPRDQALVTT